jgi:hypothetical protein
MARRTAVRPSSGRARPHPRRWRPVLPAVYAALGLWMIYPPGPRTVTVSVEPDLSCMEVSCPRGIDPIAPRLEMREDLLSVI